MEIGKSMKLIVTSDRYEASINMFNAFIENFNFVETEFKYQGNPIYKYKDFYLIKIKDDLVEAYYIDKDFPEVDLVIFASKHSSKEEIPTLTVHSDGNFCKADVGGRDYTLSIAPAQYIKSALLFYYENCPLGYRASLEVTHHGPNLNKPSIWIEVGSTIREWNDYNAITLACENIINLRPVESDVTIGFGGPHYAPKFTKIVINEDVSIGHIMPKYVMDCAKEYMIEVMIKNTAPKVDYALIDWKGTKSDFRRKIISKLDDLDIDYKKI
ncbi:MAG TPA: hypothetical protein EYH22_03195 [Candidatus Nanopusillus sp.]|nr:hypothetical protein [Candidatus Nanopusillus sp.]